MKGIIYITDIHIADTAEIDLYRVHGVSGLWPNKVTAEAAARFYFPHESIEQRYARITSVKFATEVAVEVEADPEPEPVEPDKNTLDAFAEYLRNCSDAQLQGVYEKEYRARRFTFSTLARMEAGHRGLSVEA